MQGLNRLATLMSLMLLAPLCYGQRWSHPMKKYRPWTPGQAHLLPPSPTDWLPEGHLVYFILDIVREVDLRAITRAVDAKDARGEKPYSPVMMTALLLYAYCVGVFSSRRIERATYEDVAFRVLTGDVHPHFSRIADFRRRHLDAFTGIFTQTVRLCARAGLVKLGLVAVDGSKMQANASKHKAMSYARMREEEERLAAEIRALLQRAESVDLDEDTRWGQGQRDEDLPAELRRREDIVAQGLTNQQPDNYHLGPMLEEIASNCGRDPVAVVADSGYWHPSHDALVAGRETELYLAVPPPPANKPVDSVGGPLANRDAREQMARRLEGERGKQLYARRKAIVEPVFGHIKEARGFRRFLMRGMRKVAGEWAMLTATHNLLKLFRYGASMGKA